MKHLVIDLEMCRVPKIYRNKHYKYAFETIQIGAVLLDEEYKQIATLTQYVHPDHGVIDPYIENLTGIKNCHVKHAPRIQEALLHMIDWLGDCEYKVYAWSKSDYHQLMHEIQSKQIEDERITAFMDAAKWIDYQAVFGKRFGFKNPIGLQEALERADIDAEGRFHDGLDDAINTGRLIERLELNPEYKLQGYEIHEDNNESFSYSLADLFAGLNIQIA